MKWNKIEGFDKKLNYRGNIEKGVCLPKLNEEVLFCRPSYNDPKKDIYFSGYIYEGNYGLVLVNSVFNGIESFDECYTWTRFERPKTKNNIGYAIAYTDKNGEGFIENIPYIKIVNLENFNEKIQELKNKDFKNITLFEYIKPCTYMYDYEYIKNHMINIEKE